MIAVLQATPAGEPPYGWLALFLGLTVVLVVADLWTGLRGHRRVHVPCALATLVCFVIAVRYADAVGRYWEFETLYKRIHLWGAAYPGTALALLTALTGGLHAWGKIGRTWHRRGALLFVLFLVLSVVSALLMFLHGQRLA